MSLNPNVDSTSVFGKQIQANQKKAKPDADKLMENVLGENPNEFITSALDEQYSTDEKLDISFKEDLANALNPFVLSGKYTERELALIEKRLYNTISQYRKDKEMSVESVQKGESILPEFKIPGKSFNYGIDYVEQKYIPWKSNHLQFDSEYFEGDLKNSSTYLKMYRDDVFGIEAGDNRYIEIDGIRREEDGSGGYIYNVYSIDENTDSQGVSKIGDNLQQATEQQIQDFEDKLFNFEWSVSQEMVLEKNMDIEELKQQFYNNKITIEEYHKIKLEMEAIKGERIDYSQNPLDDPDGVIIASIGNAIQYMADNDPSLEGSDKQDDMEQRLKAAFNAVNVGGNREKYYKNYKLTKNHIDQLQAAGIDPELIFSKSGTTDWEAVFDVLGIKDAEGLKTSFYRNPYQDDYGMEDFLSDLSNQQIAHQVKQIQDITQTEVYKNLDGQIGKVYEQVYDRSRILFDEEFGKNGSSPIRLMSFKDPTTGIFHFFATPLTTYSDSKSMAESRNILKKYLKEKYNVDINFGVEGIETELIDISGTKYNMDNYIEIDYIVKIIDAIKDKQLLSEDAEYVVGTDSNGDDIVATPAALFDKIYNLRKEVVNNAAKTFKPEYYTRLKHPVIQSAIKDHLTKADFLKNGKVNPLLSHDDLANTIDNIWSGIEHYLLDPKNTPVGFDADELKATKNEFYFMMFYDYLAYDESADEPGTWSNFALVDFARNLISPEGEDGIIQRLNELDEDSEEYKKLNMVIDYCRDIVALDEQYDNIQESSAAKNFFRGLWGSPTADYSDKYPFIGGIHNFFDAKYIKNVFKRKKEGKATLADELLVKTMSLSDMMEQRVSDLSRSYRTGLITKDMMPYVFEFMLTTPAYKLANNAALKLLPVAAQSTKAGKVFAFFVGALGQSAANPQQYLTEMQRMMTPQFTQYMEMPDEQFLDVSKILSDLSNKELEEGLQKLEEGKVYTIRGKQVKYKYEGGDKAFNEAFFRAFGLTYAEFATERIGGAVGYGIGKLKKIIPGGTKGLENFLKKTFLAKFSRRMGFKNVDEALVYLRQNNIGFNGVIGEIFEETVNQPIAMMLHGNKWDDGWMKETIVKDENGNPILNNDGTYKTERTFNPDFFIEIGGAVLTTKIAIGGYNIVRARNEIKRQNNFEQDIINLNEEINVTGDRFGLNANAARKKAILSRITQKQYNEYRQKYKDLIGGEGQIDTEAGDPVLAQLINNSLNRIQKDLEKSGKQFTEKELEVYIDGVIDEQILIELIMYPSLKDNLERTKNN